MHVLLFENNNNDTAFRVNFSQLKQMLDYVVDFNLNSVKNSINRKKTYNYCNIELFFYITF